MLGTKELVLLLHAVYASGWCSASRPWSSGMDQVECLSFSDDGPVPVPARAESLLQLAQFRASTTNQGNLRSSTVYDDAIDPSCKLGKHCAADMPEQRGACVLPRPGHTSNECWDICNDEHPPEQYLTGDAEFDKEFAKAVRQVRSGNYTHLSCDGLVTSKAKFDVSGTIDEVRRALEAAEEARLVTRAAAIEAKDLVNASQEKRTEAAEVMQEAATAEANALAEARKAMQAIDKLAGQKAEEEAEESEAKAEKAAATLERQRELEAAAKDAEEAAINATLKAEEAAINATLKVKATGEDTKSPAEVTGGDAGERDTVAKLKAKLEREEAHALEAMRNETEKAAAAAAAIKAACRTKEPTKVPPPPNSRPLQVNCTFNETSIEAIAKRAEARQKSVEAKMATHEAKKAVVAAKRTQAELENAKLQAKMAEHQAVADRVSKLEADLERAKSVAVRLRAELEAQREAERQLREELKEVEAAARVAEMEVAEAEVEEVAAQADVEEAAEGAIEMELDKTSVNQTVPNVTGATAPLNETGIQAVAMLGSLAEMEVFIVRVVVKLKYKVINATGLLLEADRLIHAESFRLQNRSYAVLEEDINRTLFWGPLGAAWVGTPIVVDHPEGPDLKKWGRGSVARKAKIASKKDPTKFAVVAAKRTQAELENAKLQAKMAEHQACYWKASPPCVGEFMYAGASHDGCTTEDATDGAWCSFDTLYVGRWAHCTYVCGEAFDKQAFGKNSSDSLYKQAQ